MKVSKYFILSLISVVISIVLITQWESITIWLVFYFFATIFIILLFKQISEWGISLNNHYRTYDETEEYFSNNGIFKFSKKGFFINENKNQDYIKWVDIKQIISYSVTFYENPIMFIEIYTDTKNYRFNEETLGWYQLVLHIQTNLHNVSESWHLNNLINSSNVEKVVIYNRDYYKHK